MCGIVGILGRHEVAPVILEALKRLEYRGYDSAGIATLDGGRLGRHRTIGKLVSLSEALAQAPLRGRAGIGHTRWATHGAATVGNAHPHQTARVAVVHNGIIENFRELRAGLEAGGTAFESQTDTEVIARLADRLLAGGKSPAEAVAATLAQLEGAFALLFLFAGEDDLLIAARRGSPLVIGHGAGEMYVGSDALALAPLTDRLTYLEEGDRAIITRGTLEILDAAGRPAARPVVRVAPGETRVDKAGHRHFMAKEMAEQPGMLGAILARYLPGTAPALPPGTDFAGIRRLVLVACGTAFHACEVARYWFGQIARLPVETDIASEFRYRDPVLDAGDLVIVVSQSGETADTLAALRHARARGARTLAVVNVPGSSIARGADVTVPILAGPEIGVASTKAFTAQLLVLLLLALKAGRDRGTLDDTGLAALRADLAALPGLVAQALDREAGCRQLAGRLAGSTDVLFLGRGTMFPMALEAALKLKEISYIHAGAHAAGELKHGPIALIDATLPVVILAPSGALFDKTLSNLHEAMARHGQVILLTDAAGAQRAGAGPALLVLPAVPELLAPFVYAVPAQMLAYHAALARGTDVDQPRNLAKSVTVE